MDLVNELLSKTEKLDVSLKKLRETGTALAQAEREYKIVLRQEALKLRAEESMAVTLISKIIYGVPEVADLRFKRDIAETVYKANLEAINTLKLQLRIMEAQIQREWGHSNKS